MAETREQVTPVTGAQQKNGTAPKVKAPQEDRAEKKSPVRRVLPFIFGAIILAGAAYGWHIIQYNKVHAETDDAQIDADISPILPRVSGYVSSVDVSDNQRVDSNAVLVRLDAQDLVLKVKAAEAAVENAQAMVRSAEASVSTAHANAATAEVNRRKTAADLERARGLLAGSAMTQEQFDAAKAAAESAEAQFKSVNDQAAAITTQVAVAESQVKQREADLDNAKLQLSYATINAPMAGTIAKKNVQVGEYIQAGQPLMAITPGDIWITANFKETQVAKMHPGQPVEFTLDSYPDSTFHGTVQSISPATGAKFSLLPPDNATGNFVKVTQRVPVKILVDRGDYSRSPLRPGMSVDVTVSTSK
ncbi:MAG: HlyD family secretion protein [Bacteroidota bacterium]|nr:HlyD family secretion protein [Bacteroidota bacterium]MDP4233614.1 HlyD family secretion protein [Bacteroidota bacterium]MDP4243126.1 HlyD family secretion protein [Bacteroidota bacterium]MDP4288542.1 HlyD family secretion protein [Bacteroidota bacterium]